MQLSDSLTASHLADNDRSGSEPAFRPRVIARHSALEQVTQQLREAILGGDLPVGSVLPSEAKLAQSLGVSRPIVREALGSLRALGLVHSEVGKGWRVDGDTVAAHLMLVDSYTAGQLHEVRQLLEVPGAALAATRRTDADIAPLQAILNEELVADDARRAVELDARFHVGIARLSRNPLLVRLVEELRTGLVEQSLAVRSLDGRTPQAVGEHQRLLDAIAAGDAAAAEHEMQDHLRQVSLAVRRLQPAAPINEESHP